MNRPAVAVLARIHRAARPTAALLAGVTLVAACASSPHRAVSAVASSTSSDASTSSTGAVPTTVAGQLPTVFDCGGGAYKPATLLVVCGVATTTVTNVQWSSWTASEARGQGTVNLPGHQPAPASLLLGSVVLSGNGPEFSRLTATWTGTSPDGHPDQVFQLATAPPQG